MFGRCQRVHDRAVMSEGNSNVYLLETGDTSVQINSGMGFEAPVHQHNLDSFSPAPVSHLIATQGHVDQVAHRERGGRLEPEVEVASQHLDDDARRQPVVEAALVEEEGLDSLLGVDGHLRRARRGRGPGASGQQ